MQSKTRIPFNVNSPISRHRASTRRGFTLVEMIAVLSTLLLLGIAATTMLANVADIGLQHRRAMEERSAVLRFAETFRDDVGGSIDVVLLDDAWLLRVVQPNEVVEYGWNRSSRELTRVARLRNDRGEAETISSTDRFPLNDRTDPRVEIEDSRVRVVLREPGRYGDWIVEANL